MELELELEYTILNNTDWNQTVLILESSGSKLGRFSKLELELKSSRGGQKGLELEAFNLHLECTYEPEQELRRFPNSFLVLELEGSSRTAQH